MINALAEGEDQWIADLFASYQAVGDLNKKVNPDTYPVESDRIGGDLDRLDNVINFGTAGQFNVDTDYMPDLDLGDISINTSDDTITFT